MKVKTTWLKSVISGFLRKIISKKLGVDLKEFRINDVDIQSMSNDDYVEIHLDANAIISKKDIMNLIN